MTTIGDTTLTNFEDVTPATMTVAMLKQEPHDFQTNNGLVFRSGYDDLDYLDFAMLTLLSGHDVTLVRHKGSPNIVPNNSIDSIGLISGLVIFPVLIPVRKPALT